MYSADNDVAPPSERRFNFDRWRKGPLLGRGSFGHVFLYSDSLSARKVAVKQVQIDPSDPDNVKAMQALQHEIETLESLCHERIVKYFGSSEKNFILSIFLEFMPGGSIRNLVKTCGPLDEATCRGYTRQILEGLAYLHSLRIIHRDIKGANILRDNADNIKLTDFGTAKQLHTLSMTHGARTFAGTPHWMAPEVLRGEDYGPQADIWSVGCTVVEMLTSNPPWFQLDACAAPFKIATADYPSYQLPAFSSQDAEAMLHLCFQKQPSCRPSADELLTTNFCQSLMLKAQFDCDKIVEPVDIEMQGWKA